MEEVVMEALAKKAYQTHIGMYTDDTRYFEIDARTWEDLPASSRAHWKKIVCTIIMLVSDLDCGDLV
jgi:hypothetical protein